MNRARTNYKIATILSLMVLTLAIPLSGQNAFSDGSVDQETSPFKGVIISGVDSNFRKGQVFVPTVDTLIALDFGGAGVNIADTVPVKIHQGTDSFNIPGTVFERIGTVISIDDEVIHLDLDSSVPLLPGEPHILELVGVPLPLAWFADDSGTYADGEGLFCNGPSCGENGVDHSFRTYFQPDGLIGGTVGSMSTTSLLVAGAQANMGLWSLALVGVAVAVGSGIVYKVKSNKTKEE